MSQVHNQYEITADSGGVSPITLANAVNITNNDLTVNLDGFPLAFGDTLLLFDATPDRIFGEFASSIVQQNGSVVPHSVIYDQANGDILVQGVPEPSAVIMLGLGVITAFWEKPNITVVQFVTVIPKPATLSPTALMFAALKYGAICAAPNGG